jgi:hypothetical protein
MDQMWKEYRDEQKREYDRIQVCLENEYERLKEKNLMHSEI